MSRPLRLDHAGAIWHVTSRGNERADIYRSVQDRQEWLGVLGRVVSLSGWKLHAYCMMGNHYHLVVETPVPTLSSGMRQLNGIYTQSFNRRYLRAGHLFQGRYKAILVERDAHLLELLRYVVLNPVRAGVVRRAGDWRWSSYRATAGDEQEQQWLEKDWVLSQFSSRRKAAERRYREFVSEGKNVGFEPWNLVRGQIYLGSEQFAWDAAQRGADITFDAEVPSSHRNPVRERPEEVTAAIMKILRSTEQELVAHPRTKARARGLWAFVLRKHSGLTGKELARVLKVGSLRALQLSREGEKSWNEDSSFRNAFERAAKSRR